MCAAAVAFRVMDGQQFLTGPPEVAPLPPMPQVPAIPEQSKAASGTDVFQSSKDFLKELSFKKYYTRDTESNGEKVRWLSETMTTTLDNVSKLDLNQKTKTPPTIAGALQAVIPNAVAPLGKKH